ncbi:MFS general substrate transporter [Xylariomycetidae sp. FL2044]|nr:MFS general substrate transporter [Xylariomycetidae sp. FL2044]
MIMASTISPGAGAPHFPDRGATTTGNEVHTRDEEEKGDPTTDQVMPEPDEPAYSILEPGHKKVIILIVSFAAIISPISGNIYYPAVTTLASDYNVSQSLIQLTITTYQIFQGIAPSFIANYSDSYGRRPAYAICLVIYVAANIGLALQSNYAALLVLRCLQSTGSSATMALAAGAVADVVTRAERGKFIAYASLGVTLGPALGPIIGGLLTEYLGWRSIFWFLLIFSVVMFSVYFTIVPETARSVVGNGSVPPPVALMTPFQYVKHRRNPEAAESGAERATIKAKRKRVNPLAALKILGEKEGGVTLGFGSLLYSGYFMVMTTLPIQLTDRFGFNSAQTGLCYLPMFLGALFSRWVAGMLLDWNFRRHAERLGIKIDKNRQQDIDALPIEKARLQISIPLIYLTALCVVAYGWTLESRASLAGIEVTLFFIGLFNSGGLVGLNTLVMDTHQESPATALAANNLFRCLVSAGATAVAVPLIDRIGIGWTAVFIAGTWISFSALLWLVMFRGADWRRDTKANEEAAQRRREERMSTGDAGTV